MDKRKLRIGFVSNNPVGGKTGLSRNMKSILPLLYNSNKYELFFLSQGMPDNDPNFQKLPIKCEGVFKNFDQNRFNNPNENGYRQLVSYGNMAIESFVINNKLDCLILSDDQWAFSNDFYLNTDWFKYMKKNIFPIITADSEPLLPQIIEWSEKCPNMKFWSQFPINILQSKNKNLFKNLDVIYGTLNSNIFKPIHKDERHQLRKKFNIQDDEKVIIYLGRNQLRKLYGPQIEALALFRRKYPNKKLKLLFHCSWEKEMMGWPLKLIREQNGLKKEDILCTYFCQKCEEWNIQPFEGEDLDCPICRSQKSRMTAGINSTINEEDLNKIYNICDGSCSVFTSGSFEFTNAESMLCGLPLAVPNYVCGKDFLDSNIVYEIKGSHYYEHHTGFKKFTPFIDSICDFYNYIHDMSQSRKEEISSKSINWAINNFEVKNVVKKYEEFLDKCEFIDWEIFLKKKKELNNPNAQIEDKSNDEEFILECYTKILNNPNVKENDINGFNHWKNFLTQPKDKNQLKHEMVNVFRNAALQHNQKVEPQKFEDLLIKNGKKQFLIVAPESGGDLLYVSSLFKSFRECYSKEEWNIYLATKPEFFELFEGNEYLDKILPFQDFMNNEIGLLGQGQNKGIFNGCCFVTAASQRYLNYLGNHNVNIEGNK